MSSYTFTNDEISQLIPKQETVEEIVESPPPQPANWKRSTAQMTNVMMKDGSKITMPRSYAMGGLAQRVVTASSSGFVSLLVTGVSSSGKSTFVKSLCHKIHTNKNNPPFVFKWLHSEDLMHFDKFLKSLTPHINYFVIMDDASFVTESEGMSKTKLAEIGHELTKVRHRLKGGRFIFCIINHVLESVRKSVFRNATFVVATSMVSNAKKSLTDLFGSPYPINNFAKHYRTQVLENQSKFWGNIKGSKDQLARGYKRVRL